VAKKSLILDFSEYDLNTVVADAEEIRRYNPQRFEMEQLTAICFEDTRRNIVVGYNDLSPEEFWARGHMPGMPLMPGVLMCESAAQVAGYYCKKHNLLEGMLKSATGLSFVGLLPSNLLLIIQLPKIIS